MSLLALQDLFRRYREKATGVWKLGQDPGRTIYFDYGDTVFAQSTHLHDRLTYLLVERGKVTQAQMDYALTNLKQGLSIGKNLIEMGFITQRDLLDVAKAQVERIICGGLAEADLEPVFEAKDLDANVVRLPLNTPQLLLSGVLALRDREGLLELLGPLNQVVVLQGRALMELALPPDLAKLPTLLDGTHTLLELSRESMAEPVRLGAFALFLREMGWARLHEMPPLDRHALDLAFTPEPEPLSPPLPEPFPETVPSLFETIQEAARPTTNLEHLSQSLDAEPPVPAPFLEGLQEPASEPPAESPYTTNELPEEELEPLEELYVPEALQLQQPEAVLPALAVATGQAQLPTPTELPLALPEEDQSEQPARVVLSLPTDAGDETAEPSTAPATPAAPRTGWFKGLSALILIACVLGAGGLWLRRRARRPKTQVPIPLATPVAPAKVAPVLPVEPKPAEPASGSAEEAIKQAEPAPAPKADEPAPVIKPAETAKQPTKQTEPSKQPTKQTEPSKQPAIAPAPTKQSTQQTPSKPAPTPASVPASIADRLKALERGDLTLAVRQGEQHLKEMPANHWTLRLEIACQGDTLKRVAELFKQEPPDLFLLPMVLRDSRTCYQVLCGNFPTRDAAEKGMKKLPAAFLADGNRPKPFQVSEIPKHQ